MAVQIAQISAAEMQGYLVQHRLFGCCKIISIDGGTVAVKLCDRDGIQLFSRHAIEGGDFKRTTLYAGALAMGPHGKCAINARIDGSEEGPRHYHINYEEDGLSATVSEIDLLPLPADLADSLPARVLQGRTDPFAMFSARHRLLVALVRFNRQVGGLRALLASRIDLYPHQAFVAGTVILDPVRRYILADEVGLGKTIEAGIILHDLLSRRPDARVLVLTPGTLTRQWLCELHSSFGGQVFKLADLHPIERVDLRRWSKVICSTYLALGDLGEDLVAVAWDLVVVDEVHHLLSAPHLYELVMRLSRSARDLLLLSAVPVRRRESELFRLLALLDPGTYGEGGTGEENFLAIYEAQEPLGRRLNLLSYDLTDLESGEATNEDVIARLDRLLSLPILADDEHLHTLLAAAEADPEDAAECAREAHLAISDRYRVNRRILRNRRERLISQDRLAAITRVPDQLRYESDQIEDEAVYASEKMLAALSADLSLPSDILRPFSRILLQALVDPIATLEVLTAVRDAEAAAVNSYGREMLNAVVGLGGEHWRVHLDTACAGIKAHVDSDLFSAALQLASNWQSSRSSSARWDALMTLLRGEIAAGRKTLVFAGFPGVAQRLAALLKDTFGDEAVTEFRVDLDDMAKEENIRNFRTELSIAIMVSDESGGEGRNFQFAHSLVHADLPWQPAVIEQRIGRLDRLGREAISTEVISHICVGAGTWEAGLYVCYDQGLDLFGTSISGLEFALRHLQDEIVDAALAGGQDEMHELVPPLKAIAAEERVRDDSEALLDEASYHAARAERFVRTPLPDSEPKLEAAFLDYFRALSDGKGVSRQMSADGSEVLWCLRPDDVRPGELTIVDKDAAGELGKRIGTFRRALAQQQLDAEFFTYGNPLFDAVVASLGQRLTGRTYAIACQASGTTSFVGLELIVAARPRLDATDISPSLLNLAEAIFGPRQRRRFVPLREGQSVDAQQLVNLRASLRTTGEGPRWRDLSGDEFQQFIRRFDGDLPACFKRAMSHVIPDTRLAFANELAEPLASERERITFQRRQLIEGADAAGETEVAMIENYLALIESWDVVLDGVGFLAVNARA